MDEGLVHIRLGAFGKQMVVLILVVVDEGLVLNDNAKDYKFTKLS